MFGLNPREEAIVVWALIVAAAVMTVPSTRGPAVGVVRAFFWHPILTVVVAAAAYAAVVAYGVAHTDGWYSGARHDVAVWFVAQGMVLVFRFDRASEPGYLRRVALDGLKVTALVEFVVNLYALPLAAELLIIPALFLLGGTLAVAESKPEFASAKRLINAVVTLLGIALLSWFVREAIGDWGTFASSRTAKEFAVPALMTAAFLPFVYVLDVYSTYEQVFLRMRFLGDTESAPSWRTRLRIIRLCGLNLGKLDSLARGWTAGSADGYP